MNWLKENAMWIVLTVFCVVLVLSFTIGCGGDAVAKNEQLKCSEYQTTDKMESIRQCTMDNGDKCYILRYFITKEYSYSLSCVKS